MRWLDAWIFEEYKARPSDLAVYRVLYASYLLAAVLPVGMWLRYAPRAFFNPPPSLAAVFTSPPDIGAVVVVNAVLLVLTAGLLVGAFTRYCSVGVGLALLILKSWSYSLGKIDHDILMVIVPLVLAPSRWGDVFSVDQLLRGARPDDSPKGSWPLALLAMVIGFAMFTAGWSKMTSAWLDASVEVTRGVVTSNTMASERQTWFSERALTVSDHAFWKAFDYYTVAFEVGFLIAPVRRRLMAVFLSLACLFHLGVWLLLTIPYAWSVIAYAAFVPYAAAPAVRRLITAWGDGPSARRSVTAALGLVAAVAVGGWAIRNGRPAAELLDLPMGPVVLLVGGAVGGGYLGWELWRSARGVRNWLFPGLRPSTARVL